MIKKNTIEDKNLIHVLEIIESLSVFLKLTDLGEVISYSHGTNKSVVKFNIYKTSDKTLFKTELIEYIHKYIGELQLYNYSSTLTIFFINKRYYLFDIYVDTPESENHEISLVINKIISDINFVTIQRYLDYILEKLLL